ncbi:cystatin-9-like isoform X1 [Trachypithecus francoisi]|uniref:cystatin-9-like isoform X1 n=1 Tax=Trachypithecus francoisi TaxID=54180 RepID=UPI00141BB046|nr:cystatin-9-like isoform X1 [Trachypithecus francoisi]
MLGLPWRGTLPWVLLLLLLGFQLPLIHAWHFHKQRDCDEYNVMARYLPATVEFAVHTFNQQSKDHYAYRLVQILNSWKEQTFTCFFTISTRPWRTHFSLLNKTCLEGFH